MTAVEETQQAEAEGFLVDKAKAVEVEVPDAPEEIGRSDYYTAKEVSMHNKPSDVWVSFLGNVYDLTSVVSSQSRELESDGSSLVFPLIKCAGTDISHWFDETTGDIKKYVDPIKNMKTYYIPQGRFVHVPPAEPVSDWDNSFEVPWWKDATLKVGKLSASTRSLRVKNVLTGHEHLMEVPCEETVGQIRARYLEYNAHAASYTWKALKPNEEKELEFQNLDMTLNLQDNGIADDQPTFEALGISSDFHTPVIHLYYDDDLTVA